MAENAKMWLESVKAGDRVIIRGRFGGGRSIAQVGRLTATRIMVATGTHATTGTPIETAFHRKNGQEVGGDPYSRMTLEEGIPEALTEVRNENRRRKLARELNHRNWENVPLEKLEQITAILSPPDTVNGC